MDAKTMSSQVFTISQIADMLDKSPSRINYIISRDRIKATVRVANIRLFDEVVVERIRLELIKVKIPEGRDVVEKNADARETPRR